MKKSIFFFSIFLLLTSCGKELIETEPDGYLTDIRDGQQYPYVEIGSQLWMMKNLAYETPEGSWIYNNDEKFVPDYGLLYNWDAAAKACPDGWHLPSDFDWKVLEIYIGMNIHSADSVEWRRSGNIGIPLKNKSGWYSGGNGNNESKFSALPAGFRASDKRFFSFGDIANYWSSSYSSETHAWGRAMIYYETGVYRWRYDKQEAQSVRCVKN